MSSCNCNCQASHATVRQVLMDEHRVIEQVLDAVDRMLMEDAFDAEFLAKSLDFFRKFADGCHHAKEEDELFPALESAGVPRDGGPIGCMLHDHEEGRGLLKAIDTNLAAADRGDAAALEAVRHAARRYVHMLRHHIQKEDNVLFVIAENLLSPERKARMLHDFANKEHAPQQLGKHEHYVNLANTLTLWQFHHATVDA